jgi:zinc protease
MLTFPISRNAMQGTFSMKVLATAALLLLAAGSAYAAEDVHEFQLNNGLKLIVKEDRRAPIVVSQIWYKVGSSYEYGGVTGISHVLEHMMFKGTDKHGPGEFSRIISENGGEDNAFTGRDYTAYYQHLAKDRLEVAFALEADRMRNVHLTDEEFQKERAVVQEERRLRTEDKPQSLTYEQFSAAAYRASPYRNPVIGWMSDLEALELADLRDWYRRWYAPNNAVLVVAGDVDPKEVLRLARRYFGPLEADPIRAPKPRREPEQMGVNRILVKAPARQPYLLIGFKTPVLNGAERGWEPYALEMLEAILAGGDSGRLPSNLVRGTKIAAAADADYSAYTRLPGMLVLDAVPTPDQGMPALEQALLAEIEKLKTDLVSEEELARVRAQVVASKIFERDSVHYQALQIGLLETIGLDWRLLDEHVERFKQVTAEQVREVARRYLVEDRMTVAVLEPQPIDADQRIGQTGSGVANVNYLVD